VPVAGKFEVASGAVDGVNTVFTVSSAYVPGTATVFLNGQLKREDFTDGWAETNPAAGQVTLAEAPRTGDVVQIFFIDGSPNAPDDTVEVSPLVGKLVEVEMLNGLTIPTQEVLGALVSEGGLSGTLLGTDTISATLTEAEQLHGVIAEVCE
jgi:hypothetical protein